MTTTGIPHLECMLVTNGYDYLPKLLDNIEDIMHDVKNPDKPIGALSLKMDGSPSIFAGIDPTDGVFFVATKGLFNKTRKLYKTQNEIKNSTMPDGLKVKMEYALQYLPELGIKNIVRGDLLFVESDLRPETNSWWSPTKMDKTVNFHPNTIMYKFDSNTAEETTAILKTKIGVAWHTTYTGDSLDSLTPTPNVDVSVFNPTPNVFSYDTDLLKRHRQHPHWDMIGLELLITQLRGEYKKFLENIENRSAPPTELVRLYNDFRHENIFHGVCQTVNQNHSIEFKRFVDEHYSEKAKGYTADFWKNKQIQKGADLNAALTIPMLTELMLLHSAWLTLVHMKRRLLHNFNDHIFPPKVLGGNNYPPMIPFSKHKTHMPCRTPHEGCVYTTKDGETFKIVDREVFTAMNSSDDYVKGWQR